MTQSQSDHAAHQTSPIQGGPGQSGGINLGAYNRIERIDTLIGGDQFAGDKVQGDKFEIGTLQILIYTGPAQPPDDAARFSQEQAYRSEVAARYAVWRTRYATLPIETQGRAPVSVVHQLFEREELVFAALRKSIGELVDWEGPGIGVERDRGYSSPTARGDADERHTFTDLREGLEGYGDLLLLGPPGGGKTTALWRLALDLAEAGLRGDNQAPLPVFVRLGGLQEQQSLLELLRNELASAALEDGQGRRFPLPAHRALAPMLPTLLDTGRLVLLWDGLNEVPQTLFAATAQAIEQFRRNHPGPLSGPRNRSITTCRTDDYARLVEQCGNADPLPIPQATIQGLDATTIRQIVLGRLGVERGQALLDALAQPRHRVLAALARTPLLLTMLCEVYTATGSLPANRGRLLQAFIAQRWEWERQRHPDTWIATEVQERAFAQLAYAITNSEGRGTSVPWSWAKLQFRKGALQIDLVHLRALGCQADVLELLDDGRALRFSHQLVQEYFAARALQARLAGAVKLRGWHRQRVLGRYAVPGTRTGWEETLLLLVGLDGEAGIAGDLIRTFLSRPLEAARLLLASGEEIDPALLAEVRQALLDQFGDRRRAPHERIAAGQVLGLVGDPRFPVTTNEWHRELACRNERFGAPEGYWRYVSPGTYRIGGWQANELDADVALPGFWIARFPITVAQYAPFVAVGYENNAERWWTPNGWRWKQTSQCTQPWLWGDPRFTASNQPVIGVTWYEAMAFCAWLTEQLAERLPEGCVICLPTEAEWEVATAYDAAGQHHPYPWGEQEPTPERAIYNASGLEAPAPIGCCVTGAAACGALDLAGNVWEWAASRHEAYPKVSASAQKDFTTGKYDVPLRGGSWLESGTFVRCGARVRVIPNFGYHDFGFRVLLVPRLAHPC